MNKFLAVVKREYVTKVRTKFFVIMTVLGPIAAGRFHRCARTVAYD